MTDTLGYEKYAACGCDVGALVTGRLGHKYAGELYGIRIRIRIGSGQKRTLFNGDRADWYHHDNLTAHESGGHFIPGEIPAPGSTTCATGGVSVVESSLSSLGALSADPLSNPYSGNKGRST